MSFELSVYTTEKPMTGNDLIELAAKKAKLELRLLVPIKCIGLKQDELAKPIKAKQLMVYCWPKTDKKTTATIDKALVKGDTSAILSVGNAIAWFEFGCKRFDYEKFWSKYNDERAEFEESVSAEELQRQREAKTRYVFRCGLRPPRNADFADKVANLLRDATGGYKGE